MNLLLYGRKPFLDFLRNLTSQVLFLTLLIIFGREYEFSCCDPANTKESIILISLYMVLLAAYAANATEFGLEFLTPRKPILNKYKIINRKKIGLRRYFRLLAAFTNKHNREWYFDSAVYFIIVSVALIGVVKTAIFVAAGYLNNFAN